MEGYQVTTLDDVVATADIFITATGNKDIITADHMAKMKDKAIVGNIGHFDNEIDMAGLKKKGVKRINIKPQFDEFVFPDGHSVLVLAEGRLLNLGCATGHPSFVMSASFSNQVIAQIEMFHNTREVRQEGLRAAEAPRREGGARVGCTSTKLGVKLTKLSPGGPEQAKYIGVPVDRAPYKPDHYRYSGVRGRVSCAATPMVIHS
jgi:adenosylhomocysteinase